MRFIGNKTKLLNTIFETLSRKGVRGNVFFDFFSGTSSVGKFFKKKGYKVISSDIMYFSYVLQKAYIENNEYLNFKFLLSKINITDSPPYLQPH